MAKPASHARLTTRVHLQELLVEKKELTLPQRVPRLPHAHHGMWAPALTHTHYTQMILCLFIFKEKHVSIRKGITRQVYLRTSDALISV